MRAIFCWACGLAFVAAGCGGTAGTGESGAGIAKERAALQDVGEIYRVYTATNGKPPAKFADLRSLSNVAPNGIPGIESGTVIVRYGATMTDTNEGAASTSSDEVLAYEKKVPESGGEVLMLDRTIRTMTADEFKAAKKAGKN